MATSALHSATMCTNSQDLATRTALITCHLNITRISISKLLSSSLTTACHHRTKLSSTPINNKPLSQGNRASNPSARHPWETSWWRSSTVKSTIHSTCVRDPHLQLTAPTPHQMTRNASALGTSTWRISQQWTVNSQGKNQAGNARLRLNFASFGWMDSNARTNTKSRAVVLPTVRKNFKRRRDSASSTWPQYARTS